MGDNFLNDFVTTNTMLNRKRISIPNRCIVVVVLRR